MTYRYVGPYSWQTKPRIGIRLINSHPLVNGLVGGFFCNEFVGKVTNDMVGSLVAPFTGGVSWSNGSLLFDGSTGYLGQFGSLNSYNFIQNTMIFSLVARIRLNSLTARQAFISNSGGATANKGFGWWFETIGGGNGTKALKFTISKGTSGTLAASAQSADNVINDTGWHYTAVTGAGLGKMQLYLDNSPLTTTNTSNGLSTGSATNLLTIGALSSTPSLPLNGFIDYMLIYNRTLNQQEITMLNTNLYQIFEPQIDYSSLSAKLSNPASPILSRVLLGNYPLTMSNSIPLMRR